MATIKTKFVFYLNGDELCWVWLVPSQVDRFECLCKRFCRYAAKFNYNVQFEIQ